MEMRDGVWGAKMLRLSLQIGLARRFQCLTALGYQNVQAIDEWYRRRCWGK